VIEFSELQRTWKDFDEGREEKERKEGRKETGYLESFTSENDGSDVCNTQVEVLHKPSCSVHTLTIDMACKITVTNVALAASLVKTAQQTVVVEGDDAASDEADGAHCPTQIRHDESWEAQDEGIVDCCNEMEAHLPPSICAHADQDEQQNTHHNCKRQMISLEIFTDFANSTADPGLGVVSKFSAPIQIPAKY
jgi:hypothetical protein